MQAQDRAEREKTKKRGQCPAPPSSTKAGRLCIAEKFVDFLLDHAAPVSANVRNRDSQATTILGRGNNINKPFSVSNNSPVTSFPFHFFRRRRLLGLRRDIVSCLLLLSHSVNAINLIWRRYWQAGLRSGALPSEPCSNFSWLSVSSLN